MNRIWMALCLLLLAAPTHAAQDLLETYGQALRNDPQLATAQAAVGAAKARYRQARGQLLPQLSLSAGYNQVTSDASRGEQFSGDRSSIELNLSQTLFDWSAWQTMGAVEAQTERARVQLSAAKQALIVRVTQAYFDVLAARDALLATRERRSAILRQLDRAKAAFRSGLAPITDKQEARSSLDAVRVDVIAAQNELAIARQRLRALTGQAPRPLAGIAVHQPTRGAGKQHSRQAWLELAAEHAPTLHAARATLTAARQQIAAARGEHYPDIALVGSVGRNERPLARSTFDDVTNTTQTWAIGVQLQMPIFAGGTIAATVDEAIYAAEQARLQWVATRRQLRLDVGSAWRNVRAARDQVAALDQAIKSAATAVDAARAGYRLGNRTILDVIEAETELAQRKAARKQAWYDHALARLQLREAAGVLDRAALIRISTRLTAPTGGADESSP